MILSEAKKDIIKYLERESPELVLREIREDLKKNIFDADLYCYMGLVYEQIEKYDSAYLCFENALEYLNKEKEKDEISAYIDEFRRTKKFSVKKFSIILLTYNNLEYTKQCIESIRKYNKLDNYEIIVVDNNSSDDTPLWLKSQENIKCIFNKENKGFPAGCNQGICIAEKDNDIFLLNNDTVIMPNSIFNLRMALYSDDKAGAVGSVSNNVAYYQKIKEQLNNLQECFNYSLTNNITNDNSYDCRLKLIGFALLMKRKVLDKVGLLDERFTPGNFEDDDICLRIIKAGYKNILCKDSFIFHYGSVSFSKNLNKYNSILERNRIKFKNKWKFDSNYSLFIRNEIIELIKEENNKQLNILEIGCACGATLLEIKNRYPNANLFGIELNREAVQIAEKFADVIPDNIEDSELNYEKEYFDYIIFADVLEHLRDPLNALRKMRKYLKPGGYILASIPNVLNYTVLRDLINGNWTYKNSGILDRTHLKFFTYKEIIKMFKLAHYSELEVASNRKKDISDQDIEFINKISQLSDYSNAKSELKDYQYIIKVKNDYIKNIKIEKGQNAREKFDSLVQKIEANLKDVNLFDDIIGLIKQEDITDSYIIASIEKNTMNQGKILNDIAVKCFENQLEQYVIPLLREAVILEPLDLEITYNLSYFLVMIKEYDLALEHLNTLNESNDLIKQLKEYIIQQI